MGQQDSRRSDEAFEVQNVLSGATGSAVQAGSVTGDIVINQPPAVRLAVPDQVPRTTPRFVNRVHEMTRIDAVAGDGGSPQVVLVSGMAGVGKSEIVRKWVARQREAFPDGRLYVDLAALRTPDGTAVGDGLAECLRALGVDEAQIPSTLTGRSSLFRTKMADGRRVVVLDDVTEPSHVAPFVPGGGRSVVLVTSNSKLVELTLDGATVVELAPLTADEGVQLLSRLCGDGRVEADPEASAVVAAACAGLPVALRVAAARLLARRHLTVAALAAELVHEERRLAALSVGGEQVVSVVFDNSYRALDSDAAALYRVLGLLPFPHIAFDLVPELLGTSAERARDLLDPLVQANLLDERAADRFAFHDLVRLHARECALREEPPSRQIEVLDQALHHYLPRLCHADQAVMGNRLRVADHLALTGGTANPFPDGDAGRRQAIDWMVAERANLLALVRWAGREGRDDAVWQLAEALTALYLNRRYLDDWTESAEAGARAARRAGNPAAEARLRSVVSRAYTDLGEHDRAEEELRLAREQACRAGDALLSASVWEFTGRHLDQTDPAAAVEAYQRAMEGSRVAGSDRGVALAMFFLARALHAAGQHTQALATMRQAHEALEAVGDSRMAGRALIGLGALRREAGQLREAQADLERAAGWFTAAGMTQYEAEARLTLVDVLGDTAAAVPHLERVVEIRLAQGADVTGLRAVLRRLTGTP
ncbi:Tetratricopeptide repeat-containing protein [Lentzea albidocapillata subsp. violacea]|uniref:Tetratricopeptide repeat-containing protein n=1 Tax=Lentzea albidocapillata subsp. violacea TaxID=128104 RepID=A0A1G8SIJ2_9PSEU|nr:tetratricopeptide repeat protein [Lentzea albidocapillata]SDJ28575.1 Tetratricopeptide repeat-containing protein [Lentzea albidocapillata subsp. violacea]